MKCPECKNQMKKIKVKIQDALTPVTSFQCGKCGYFEFEDTEIEKAIKEIKLKEMPLKIKQKIIKLSQDRLGMYFNRDIVRSLDLKSGEDVFVSIPDKNHIVLELNN